MPTSGYPESVLEYVRSQGWSTNTNKIRDGSYIVLGTKKSELGSKKMVLMIVCNPESKVRTDHIKYLLKTGKKKNANKAKLTATVDISNEVRQTADNYDIEIIEQSDISGGTNNGLNNNDDGLSMETPDNDEELESGDGGRNIVTRRRVLLLGVGIGAIALVGGNSGDANFDTQIEYETTVGKEPEQIPEALRGVQGVDNPDGRLQEGNKWVVVEIYVQSGELDMEDIWFRSRVETNDRFHELNHVSDELTDGIQSRGNIAEGGYGIALYQMPENSDFVSWNLEETHQNIEANKR